VILSPSTACGDSSERLLRGVRERKKAYCGTTSSDGAFLIGKKVIIGRKGLKKFLWISKKGLISVNKDGKYISTADILQVKEIKQSFQNIFGKPLANLFSSIQDAFSKFV